MARRQLRGYSLSLEHLEDRLVPTSSGDFLALSNKIKGYLDSANGIVSTVVNASQAKLPIINQSLGEMTGTATAIAEFKDKIKQVLDTAGSWDANKLETEAEKFLHQYMGNGPEGIDIELAMPEVTLPATANDDLINVKLHLGKQLSTPDFELGLGLDSMPFKAHFEASAKPKFSVGFQITTMEFGLDKNATFFIKPMTLEFQAEAALLDPHVAVEIGFLHGEINENPANPNGNNINVTFGVQIDPNQVNNPNQPVVSKPKLTGGAHVDVLATLGIEQSAQLTGPSIQTNFVLNWDFYNSQAEKTDSTFGNNLTVDFKDVKVNLGSYLTQMVGPTIQKIQQFTDPYKDFFKLLGDPIPVISDIAKVVGDNDGVSLLDIAGIVGDSGEIPPEYAALIKVAKAVIQVTNVIDSIQLEKGNVLQDAWIDLNDFNVIGNQGSHDVREVASAINSGFGNAGSPDWSALQKIVEDIDLSEIKQKINDVVGEDLGNKLGDALENLKKAGSGQGENYANIKLDFPLTDHPAQAIFGLLIGQDTDLVSFEANAHLKGAGDAYVFNYEGFEIKLIGGIDLDAHLRLAYDTFGLRTIATNYLNTNGASGESNGQNIGELLLDGLYLDPTSHLTMGGFIGVEAGLNYTLFSASISAKLEAGVNAYIPDGQDANGDGKVRVSEFTSNLFNIDGQLSGYLELHAALGVDPLALHFDQTLAGGEIVGFHIGATNPFEPGDDLALATKDASGKLTLNMGSFARRQNRHYKQDIINENYIITHVDAQPGDPAGETVMVTAFGFTQKYQGVTSIFAEGEEGNDSITIDENVLAPVTLKGGLGSDTLIAQGKGIANLEGGDGNDILTGGRGSFTAKGDAGNDTITAGIGNAFMYGGLGDDKILGGKQENTIFGDEGNDYLVGGQGLNLIHGGAGNDRLYAGIAAGDTLWGDEGNDILTPGTGFTKMFGGIGNDNFVWHFVDPDNGFPQSDGGLEVNGGEGTDTITAFGGVDADTFTVSKTVNNPNFTVQMKAPFQSEAGFGYTSILINQMENIDIEGGLGADVITINELTNTRIQNVGINLNDLVKNNYGFGDNGVDKITVYGTTSADAINVKSEDVAIQQVPSGTAFEIIKGGITTIGIALNAPVKNEYLVKVANIRDDVQVNALAGNDVFGVQGISGPTIIRGNGGLFEVGPDDDTFNVSALTTKDFVEELNIEGNGGKNTLNVSESGSYEDSYYFMQNRIESGLLRAVNFTGDFTGGVSLTTGTGKDFISIRSTLPGLQSFIKTGKGDDSIVVGTLAPQFFGNLTAIVGGLTIDMGEGTNNQLAVSDYQAGTGNANVLIDSTKIAGMAGLNDSTTINYGATGGSMSLYIVGSNSATNAERFVVNNPNAKLSLLSMDGDDKIDIVANNKPVDVQGGDGNDQITIGYGNNKLDAILGAINILAGKGLDSLKMIDSQTASGKTYGVATSSIARTGAGVVTFDASLEGTTVFTSNLPDEISVVSMPITKVNVEGGNGIDRITGPNASNSWFIQGVNKGTLGATLGFSSMEKLLGGAGNDRFIFSGNGEMQNVIDGGLGNNAIDYSALTTAVTVNLQAKTASRTAGYQNVKEFVGSKASDLFIAPDLANGWTINALNGGQVSTLAQGLFKFTGFENLQGGTAADGFSFTSSGGAGNIDGKGGIDTLDYSTFTATMPISVNLMTGSATQVKGIVVNIENVNGGAGNDIIVGNNGINVVNGGAGRDLLIGGKGGDTLIGGAGEDLLIAGTTPYDQEPTMKALNAIMLEWASGDDYNTRRQHLQGKLMGGKNGTFILTKQLLLPDGSVNKLTGSPFEKDWFWASLNEITDLNQPAGEKVADAV